MEVVIIFLGFIVTIAAYQLYKNRASAAPTESISQPPPPPQVTPTVVIHNIIIGEAAYFDNEVPDLFVTILEADAENVRLMLPDASITTLPVTTFLLRYSPRQPTKISKER